MGKTYDLQDLGTTPEESLIIDPKKNHLENISGSLTNASKYFRMEAKNASDLYLALGNLKTDLDLYLYKSNPNIDPSAKPFVSSSNMGLDKDYSFTQIKKGEEIYVEIRKNYPIPIEDDFSLCLELQAYETGKNPFLKIPNDPLFNQQWHLFNGTFADSEQASAANLNFDLYAPEAWENYSTGSRNIPIAIIDTGVDIKHPDLTNNLWINQKEKDGIPGNDDDNNGYIDDIHGWSFHDKTRFYNNWVPQPKGLGQPNGRPRNAQGEIGRAHGTHVAGIIGAEGNNGIGGSGINWNTSLMALNAATDNNTFPVVNLIEAMNYAIDNGAKIINMSLSSVAKATPEDFKKEGFYDDYFDHTKSQLRKVFNKAIRKDILIVMAAGNSGQLSAETQGWKGIGNLDQTSHGIHSFAKKRHLRNIILVGSVDPDRRISNYSSYGKKRVDIAAPGGNKVKPIFETDPITGQVTSTKTADYGILSTMVTSNASEREKSISMITKQGNYISENGTSMAAPMVSGAAALVWGENESLGPDQVKKILMRSAEKIDHLKPFIRGGRSLNLLNAMDTVNDFDADLLFENSIMCGSGPDNF